MPTEAQRRAKNKYEASTYKKYTIRLRNNEDAELIAKIEQISNKQQFITEAIIEKLKKG